MGQYPPGLGGTIASAREHLHEAMTEIPQVMGAHPMIDHACRELSGLLPEIAARLEKVEGREEWVIVQGKLQLAETAAYGIPEALYRREYPAEPEPSTASIVLLTTEQKEILDTLSAAKKGEISQEEARKKLTEIVGPGE